MRITTLLISSVFLLLPLLSQAEQALSKELIVSFEQLSRQWQSFDEHYPEVSASLENIDLSQVEKVAETIKKSKAYPEVKAMLADSEFNSIEEYYRVAMRIMGGMMAYQMQNMPDGMNVDSMSKMLESNIEQMKGSNASTEIITEMEKQLAEMKKSMNMMKQAMANASQADKVFISNNAQWIMSILDNE